MNTEGRPGGKRGWWERKENGEDKGGVTYKPNGMYAQENVKDTHYCVRLQTEAFKHRKNSNPVLGSLRLAEDMASKFRSTDTKSKTQSQKEKKTLFNPY